MQKIILWYYFQQGEGDFALHVATRVGNTEIVKLLVENGADVDIQNVSYSSKRESRNTVVNEFRSWFLCKRLLFSEKKTSVQRRKGVSSFHQWSLAFTLVLMRSSTTGRPQCTVLAQNVRQNFRLQASQISKIFHFQAQS